MDKRCCTLDGEVCMAIWSAGLPISGIFQGWKWMFVHLVLCDLLVDVCDIDVEGKRPEVSHEPSKYM